LSLVATDKMIKERPELVARFTRAFQKTVAFMIADPTKAAKDLKVMVPGADVESDAEEIASLKPLIQNELTDKYGQGQFSRRSWSGKPGSGSLRGRIIRSTRWTLRR